MLGADSVWAKGDWTRLGVQDHRADNSVVIDVSVLVIEKVGGLFADGTTHIRRAQKGMIPGLAYRKGIAGIERQIVSVRSNSAVNLIGSRLGEDFNSTIADPIVCGRERVLVDMDFANGIFRGGELVSIVKPST